MGKYVSSGLVSQDDTKGKHAADNLASRAGRQQRATALLYLATNTREAGPTDYSQTSAH